MFETRVSCGSIRQKHKNTNKHAKHARKQTNNVSTLSGSNHCSRANTPVVVEGGYSLQNGRACRLYRWFCPMSAPQITRTEDTTRKRSMVRVSFCGLLSKRANLYRGLNRQSVPYARHEEANRPRSPAPPPPLHSSQHFFLIYSTYSTYSTYIQQFSCHHLPAPNKNSSYMLAFPNRKINKYEVRRIYFKTRGNSANFPLLFPPVYRV